MPDLEGSSRGSSRALGAPTGTPIALDGGITNRNFRVRFGGRDYVVRLPGKDTALLGIGREAGADRERRPRRGSGSRRGRRRRARVPRDPRTSSARRSTATRFARDPASDRPGAARLPRLGRRAAGPLLGSRAARPTTPAIVLARGGALPDGYAARRAGRPDRRRAAARRPGALPQRPAAGNLMRRTGDDERCSSTGSTPGWATGSSISATSRSTTTSTTRPRSGCSPPTSASRRRRPQRAALKLMRIMSDAREAAWGVVQGVDLRARLRLRRRTPARTSIGCRSAAADPRLAGVARCRGRVSCPTARGS